MISAGFSYEGKLMLKKVWTYTKVYLLYYDKNILETSFQRRNSSLIWKRYQYSRASYVKNLQSHFKKKKKKKSEMRILKE